MIPVTKVMSDCSHLQADEHVCSAGSSGGVVAAIPPERVDFATLCEAQAVASDRFGIRYLTSKGIFRLMTQAGQIAARTKVSKNTDFHLIFCMHLALTRIKTTLKESGR